MLASLNRDPDFPLLDILMSSGHNYYKNNVRRENWRPAVYETAVPMLSHRPESNWRPTVYETVALPTELRWQIIAIL